MMLPSPGHSLSNETLAERFVLTEEDIKPPQRPSHGESVESFDLEKMLQKASWSVSFRKRSEGSLSPEYLL